MRKPKAYLTASDLKGFILRASALLRKLKIPWYILLIAVILVPIYCSNKQRHIIRDYGELITQAFLYPIRIITDVGMGIPNETPAVTVTLEQLYSHISEDQQMKMLVTENQKLKELLDFRQHHHLRATAVRVMGYSRAFGQHRLFVNAGSIDGLTEGAVVIHPDGLVGQIITVNQYSAWIMTIHDPLSRIPTVMAISRHKAITAGSPSGSASLFLQYTDFSAPTEDEVALTSGEGSLIPEGLYIGKVIKKQGELRVLSSVPWATLDYVLVLSFHPTTTKK
ncbi:MAG: rod shape-determining protein MreC [Proteobacteria bacterium]|nr:rod shape-determining protein MreC [Pseudomonadota bacterium]